MTAPRALGLAVLAAAGCGHPAPTPQAAAARPVDHAPAATAAATLCTVMRAYAPRSIHWAFHGCPADPAPVPAHARPCRVIWGDRPAGATELGYDADGRLTSVRNTLLAWSYQYDTAGQLTSITLPDGAITVRRDATAVVYRSALGDLDVEERFVGTDGRLQRIERGPADPPWHLAYRDDQLVSITGAVTIHDDEAVTRRFTWDAAGRLARIDTEQPTRPPRPLVETFTWDADGRLTGLHDPDGPTRVEYDCAAALH